MDEELLAKERGEEEERRVLIILLSINGFMFLTEATFGFFSESTALIADSIDMLADAAVYGISLYAVGRPGLVKIKAAQLSGIFQTVLGVSVLIDVLRRFIWGSEPVSFLMVGVGFVALVANVYCLQLVSKHREGEVHMRASWIFSKNDVLANLGTIVGGGMVYLLGSRFPDLIIGFVISILVIRGGFQILKDAEKEKMAVEQNPL